MWSIEKLFGDIRQTMPSGIIVSVHESPHSSMGFYQRFQNILAAGKAQADVNHITGDIHYIALGLQKNKTILTIHDLGFMNQYRGLARFILWLFWIYIPVRRVRYVVAISEATKNEIIRYARCRPEKIKIIPDFVSSDFTFSNRKFNSDSPVILQIGAMFNKNIERVAAALENISCKLIIVGEINESQKKILNNHRINYQNFHGLSQVEIVELYRTCDLVSFCSLLEGFGLPILEAQATGRAVITSNLSSMPEVAGNAACYVDPYDISSIREGFIKVINDEAFRNDLIEKGFVNVKRYSLETVASQYAALYEDVYRSNQRK